MSEFTEEYLKEAHRHCSNNREELENSQQCGCFYCLNIYSPKDIYDWVDKKRREDKYQTAICPKCGIDSVVAAASGYPIVPSFLEAMNDRWFSVRFGGKKIKCEWINPQTRKWHPEKEAIDLPRQRIWFVTSIEIKKNLGKQYSFKQRFVRSLHSAIYRADVYKGDVVFRRCSMKERIKRFKDRWKDLSVQKWPIVSRTWGFFREKEVALRAIQENWTDIYEYRYLYAVAEEYSEGMFPSLKQQVFFEWNGEKWTQLDKCPEIIDKTFTEHHQRVQFVNVG